MQAEVPVASWALPASHLLHEAEPIVAEYSPWGQLMQRVALASEYLPIAHSVQVPSCLAYLPAVHPKQTELPITALVPASHVAHMARPAVPA